MAADAEGTNRIHGSLWRPLFVVGGSCLLLALTGVWTFKLAMPTDALSLLLGLVCFAGFGAFAAAGLWFLYHLSGIVVTLAPAGLRDVRLAPQPIAWPEIWAVSPMAHQGQPVIVLVVDPAAARQLTLTWHARLTRQGWRKLGVDGLFITAAGLKMSHGDLLDLCQAYAARYGPDANAASASGPHGQ